MRYIVKSAGDPPKVITETDGTVRIHVEGQPEALDLVMTSEQFDAFLGHATEVRRGQGGITMPTRRSLGHGE